MQIIQVKTSNKQFLKNGIIKNIIKAGMQYVEMEDEILIEGNYLIRISEQKDYFSDSHVINFKNMMGETFYIEEGEKESNLENSSFDFSGFKKKDYSHESKRVNKMVKTKQHYNRRRYR